jgi:hypothetical protein
MTTRPRKGKRTRSPSVGTSCEIEPVSTLTGAQLADAMRDELVTLDALAAYVANNLEDATSEDPERRRRFGRLLGLLADHAAGACASAIGDPRALIPNGRLSVE